MTNIIIFTLLGILFGIMLFVLWAIKEVVNVQKIILEHLIKQERKD